MDKGWMFLPRQTEEYRKGLENFLDFAFSDANINGTIACPCARCKIGICVSREDAYDHLTVDGFIKGYTHWVAHGEIARSASSISSSVPSCDDVDDMEGLVHKESYSTITHMLKMILWMKNLIKEKYDLPPRTESWTLCSIAKKWRNWKSKLKKKYYDPELPMQVLLQERDNRAFVKQYVKLVVQWNSEKSKRKEKGRPPSRVELFHACFTHANGSPSSNIVAEKLLTVNEEDFY